MGNVYRELTFRASLEGVDITGDFFFIGGLDASEFHLLKEWLCLIAKRTYFVMTNTIYERPAYIYKKRFRVAIPCCSNLEEDALSDQKILEFLIQNRSYFGDIVYPRINLEEES